MCSTDDTLIIDGITINPDEYDSLSAEDVEEMINAEQ